MLIKYGRSSVSGHLNEPFKEGRLRSLLIIYGRLSVSGHLIEPFNAIIDYNLQAKRDREFPMNPICRRTDF